MQGRGVLEKLFFSCFTCLSRGSFFLCIRRATGKGARDYVPIKVAALTALFVCLFRFEKFDLVIYRVSRALFALSISYAI